MPNKDDDFLDHEDFASVVEPDDDVTAALRPLFPEGVDDGRWDGLFKSGVEVPFDGA